MKDRFSIEVDWERIESGSPEDRATYGAIGIRLGNVWLTDAHDVFARRVRSKVYLSGYQLAQWFAWNWWRLRWEPKRQTVEWKMAHRLPTIGGGYIWPNVEMLSDGERFLIRALPTRSRPAEPLRYVSDVAATLTATEFLIGVEDFVNLIVGQLSNEGVADTNLSKIWRYVCDERGDSNADWYRRLEAALGFDPDEADAKVVESLIADAEKVGTAGVAELAANASRGECLPSASELAALADSTGHDTRLSDIPKLPAEELKALGAESPAWAVGESAAKMLRSQERLGDGVISDEKLAELAGTSPSALRGTGTAAPAAPFSFALNGHQGTTKLVIRSPFETNRRFDLARLIGDRVLAQLDEPLIPILRSFSYRQKRQRAFAAEFLCPFGNALSLLDVELSDESQECVASEFKVSPWVIRTQLVNNGLLDRDTLDRF